MDNVLREIWSQRTLIFERIDATKLDRYDATLRLLNLTDVSRDERYQSIFNIFYGTSRRSSDWRHKYFAILEDFKSDKLTEYPQALNALYNSTGRVEASFASKIVATIRPEKPVYDSFVLKNLKLNKPAYYKKADEKIADAVRTYGEIEMSYDCARHSDLFSALMTEFDEHFPKFKHFTDVKKLDIFLWQMRK